MKDLELIIKYDCEMAELKISEDGYDWVTYLVDSYKDIQSCINDYVSDLIKIKKGE